MNGEQCAFRKTRLFIDITIANDHYVVTIGFSAPEVTRRIFVNVDDFSLAGAGASSDVTIAPNSTIIVEGNGVRCS
jgi:hypothetical protein